MQKIILNGGIWEYTLSDGIVKENGKIYIDTTTNLGKPLYMQYMTH